MIKEADVGLLTYWSVQHSRLSDASYVPGCQVTTQTPVTVVRTENCLQSVAVFFCKK
jgi:hypothetical protein